MKSGWQIGEMAALLGTSAKTLRHYESRRLLVPPKRTASGYRLYDAEALNRANLVIGLRRLGLSLPEVVTVVAGAPSRGEIRRRLAAVLDEKIRDADEQIGILEGRREDLAARQRRLMLEPQENCLCGLLSMPCTCGGTPPVTGKRLTLTQGQGSG